MRAIMTYIFRIEPYVYVNTDGNNIIFYNTANGSYEECSLDGIKWNISDNLFKIEFDNPDDKLDNLSLSLKKKYIAYVIDIEKPIFSENIFEKILSEFHQRNDRKFLFDRDELKNCITELTICLNGANRQLANLEYLSKQFSVFSNAMKDDRVIDLLSLKSIFLGNNFYNVNAINLTGHNLLECPILFDVVDLLGKEYKIRLYLTYSEYVLLQEKPVCPNLEYYLICDDLFLLEFTEKYFLFANEKIVLNFYLKDNDDIEYLSKNEKIMDLFHFNVFPYFSGDLNFLSKLIAYSKCDIFDNIESSMKIVRNDLINELFFGKIVIHNDGSILTNIQCDPIGNIKDISFSEVLAKAALDEHSWLYVRKQFHPCRSCLYNKFCPSVSYIELLTNRTFCDQNKSGFQYVNNFSTTC